MSPLGKLGAVLAAVGIGVPALLGASLATAGPSGASGLFRCETCSPTSCSPNARYSPRRALEPPAGAKAVATPSDTGVPGSDTAVIYSNFPTQDKANISIWKKVLVGENYKVTEDLSATTGQGTATLANFVAAAKAGVFIISTHGADLRQNGFDGLLVSEFPTQAALDAAWNADEKHPTYRNGVLKKLNFVDNHRKVKVYSLWITKKGVQKLFAGSSARPADQLVFDGACWSDHLAAAFGATAYFGYTQPASDAEVYGDLGLLLGRLDGTKDNGLHRDTTGAWDAGGFTNTRNNQLSYHAQPATKSVALSPGVSDIKYPDGQDVALPGDAGPFMVEFNAAMDKGVRPSSFLAVKGATLTSITWSSSAELTLYLKRPGCTDVCPVTLTIDAKKAVSAGIFHNWLDGNLKPAGGQPGVYPNGDNEEIPFSFASWHLQVAPDPSPNCSGLFSVAAASPTDVWAVGAQGLGTCVPWGTLTEHWNGRVWTTVPSASPAGTNDHLFGVTVAGPKDYWAVGFTQTSGGAGQALIEHSTGSSWTTAKLYSLGFYAELWAASASGPKDVWAVGYGETRQFAPNVPIVMHYNGSGWTETSPVSGNDGGSTELLGVDAVSGKNIWAVGLTVNAANTKIRAIMLHSTGGAFSEAALGGITSSSSYGELDSISAVSPTDIWAVGYARNGPVPLIEHYDGTKWISVPSGLPTGVELLAVTAVNANSAWATGLSFTGSSGQVIIHWDGKKWSRVVAPNTKYSVAFGLASLHTGYAVGVGSVLSSSPFIEAFTP